MDGVPRGTHNLVEVFGVDLTEASTALSFDFGGADNGWVLFQSPTIGSGMDYVCFAAGPGCDLSSPGTSLCLTGCNPQPDHNQFTMVSGVGSLQQVPEPSSFVLLSLGVGALIARSRYRRAPKPEDYVPPSPFFARKSRIAR